MIQLQKPQIPFKHRPKGLDILHEDLDIIVVNKYSGFLTVAALWEKENTIHESLNRYLKKGNTRSQKSAFVVHRLDQATSGVLIFAKSEEAQDVLKSNWPHNTKIYLAITEGLMKTKKGTIESFLKEDEDYHVHSSQNSEHGKLAITEYEVLAEYNNRSLIKVNLITGKKNQIRVHLAEAGCPIIGDTRYQNERTQFKGKTQRIQNSQAFHKSQVFQKSQDKKNLKNQRPPKLMLHSFEMTFHHPYKGTLMSVRAPVPDYFERCFRFDYTSLKTN